MIKSSELGVGDKLLISKTILGIQTFNPPGFFLKNESIVEVHSIPRAKYGRLFIDLKTDCGKIFTCYWSDVSAYCSRLTPYVIPKKTVTTKKTTRYDVVTDKTVVLAAFTDFEEAKVEAQKLANYHNLQVRVEEKEVIVKTRVCMTFDPLEKGL